MQDKIQIEEQLKRFKESITAIEKEISKVIIGHREVIEQVLISVFCGGHSLLEGVPGLGKTLLVRTLSEAMNLKFSRIQFTPDLMPADITGTNIIVEEGGRRSFKFQKGPIFGNVILADEINRATPKTQSALLEAMQEHSVTVSGEKHTLEEPFFVFATQNPIEMEGTYPLPEAQLDRFLFKIKVDFSNKQELIEIIGKTTSSIIPEVKKVVDSETVINIQKIIRDVPVAQPILDYVARLVLATSPKEVNSPEITKRYIRYGVSPRGGQSVILASKVLALKNDRFNVSFDDIKKVIFPAFRHRIILNFEGEAEGVITDSVISKILEKIPEVPQAVHPVDALNK